METLTIVVFDFDLDGVTSKLASLCIDNYENVIFRRPVILDGDVDYSYIIIWLQGDTGWGHRENVSNCKITKINC